MVNADETSQTTLYGLFPTIRPVALFYAFRPVSVSN